MMIRSDRRRLVPNLKKLAARGLLAFGLFLMGNFAAMSEAQAYLQFFRTDAGTIYEYNDEVCQYDEQSKTLKLISDNSSIPLGASEYMTQLTQTNDLGWLLNSQGYTVILPGSPFPVYANGSPIMNDKGQLLKEDGSLFEYTSDIKFDSAHVKPNWGNGQMPTPDGKNRSGTIDLKNYSRNIFDTGYNGSNLTYYFNDETDKLDAQREAINSNIIVCKASFGTATAALLTASLAFLIDPSGAAIAGATVCCAGASMEAAKKDLEIFDTYTENFVGAIDFNSSLTVQNSGSLRGVYQNIETMSLETENGNVQFGGNEESQRGDFIVIDKISSNGAIVVNQHGNVAEVNSIYAETLTNNGTIINVGYLSAVQLSNSGSMTALGTLEASNLTNTQTGIISAQTTNIGAELENAGTFINFGQIKAGSITNSGKLLVGGSVSADSFTNSSFATIAGSLKTTGDIVHSNGTLNVDGAISAANIQSGGTWYSAGAIQTDGLTITGTETFVSMGSIQATGTIRNGNSSATMSSVKGVTYFRENVSAFALENNRVLGTSGNVEVFGTVVTGFYSVWNAFGSVQVGYNMTNYGTIYLAENLTVASDSSPKSAEITNYGTINGMSANASVLIDGNLIGNEDKRGTVSNLAVLTVRGNAENNNIQMTGSGSVMNVGGTLTNAAVSQVGTLTVSGAVTNSSLTGSGNGSVITLESGVTGGSISNVDDLKISGGADVDAVSGVDRFSSLAVDGNLSANGAVSQFGKVNVKGNATFDTITDAEILNVSGVVSGNKITGTGAGSQMNAGQLGADGINAGEVTEYENVFIDSDLNNTAKIEGTGLGQFQVSGNLTNSGSTTRFFNFQANAVNNSGTLSGSGAGTVASFATLDNTGAVAGLETLTVAGAVNNTGENATITGTGANSRFSGAALINEGQISAYSNFQANAVNNSGRPGNPNCSGRSQ